MFPISSSVHLPRDDGLLTASSSALSGQSATHGIHLNHLSSLGLSGLSSALQQNPLAESLRRGGSQIYNLLASAAGNTPDMNRQTTPGGSLPFGYEVFGDQNGESLGGQGAHRPLLNPQEDNFLENFWQSQGMPQSSSSLADIAAFGRLTTDQQALEEQGLSWLVNQPPPTVHEVTSASVPPTPSFQHQQLGLHMPQHIEHHSIHQNLGFVFPESSQHMHLNQEDIMGAALLSQQAMQASSIRSAPLAHMSPQPLHHQPFGIQRSPSMSSQLRPFHSPTIAGPLDSPIMSSITASNPMTAPVALTSIPASLEASRPAVIAPPPAPRIDTAAIASPSVPAAPHTAPAGEERSVNPRLYQFGSDNMFNENGFQASFEAESHDFKAEQLTSELRRMRPINRTPQGTRAGTPDAGTKTAMATNGKGTMTRDRKRSREEDTTQLDSHTKKHKRSASDAADGKPQGSARRRRTSAAANAKAKRENLSDAQKRKNHIQSEQKRRAQIKDGFEELAHLVPELRDTGLSKSNMLNEAYDFMVKVMDTCGELRNRLGLPARDDAEWRSGRVAKLQAREAAEARK